MVNLNPSSPQPTLNVLRDVSNYFGIRFSEPTVRAGAATPMSSRKPAIPHKRLPESVRKRLRVDAQEVLQVNSAADSRECLPAELLGLQQRVEGLMEENRNLREDSQRLREDNQHLRVENQHLRKDSQHKGETILTLLGQLNSLKTSAQVRPCCHVRMALISASL